MMKILNDTRGQVEAYLKGLLMAIKTLTILNRYEPHPKQRPYKDGNFMYLALLKIISRIFMYLGVIVKYPCQKIVFLKYHVSQSSDIFVFTKLLRISHTFGIST